MTAPDDSPAHLGAAAAHPGRLQPSLRLRVGAYALALFFLVADQWTKVLAVEGLANPAHPMVVRGDGVATARSLFDRAGVDGPTIERAIQERIVWRLAPAVGLDPAAPVGEATPQLVLLAGGGLPTPRRLRLEPEDAGKTLGQVIETHWRADPAAVLADKGAVWQAHGAWARADEVVPSGAALALLVREVDVIDGFMRLVYAENPGAAWSLLRDAPVTLRTGFFLLVSALASLAMIWAIWTGWMGTWAGTLALGGVLGGAIGNMLDRGRYTVVVDFILNYVQEHRWPVWNIADAGITVGIVAILLEMLLGLRHGGAPDDAVVVEPGGRAATPPEG